MYMRKLFVDGILRHVTLFRSRKMEGWNLFLLTVSAYVILPFKCFLISFLLFAILVYSLWRKVLECCSLTYPVFDVIKAMWRFTLFQLEKSTVESNHPILGRWCPFRSFFKVFVNRDVSMATDFCIHALKNLHFLLKYVVFQGFLINLLAYILLIY